MADTLADDARPRRGKGRPVSPANAVGREALIKAACELLEQLPPSKVTRAEVARHAGVDPALIRYYFQDRASLLKAVVDQIIGDRFKSPIVDPSWPIEEQIRETTRSFFHFMSRHPYFHRLVIEELAGADSDEARDMFRQIQDSSIQRLKTIIDEGVAQGVLRPVNPVMWHIAQIGLADFFVSARPVLESTLGDDVDMKALSEEYAAFIGDMVVGALVKRP